MDVKGKFPNGVARLMQKHSDGPTALAAAIGTSKQNVSRWAEQSRKVPTEMARKIAQHYKVDLADVLLPEAQVEPLPPAIREAFMRIEGQLTAAEERALLDILDLIARSHRPRTSDTRDIE